MSKSLGNFFTIRLILDQYDAEIVRLFLMSTHYRSPIDFSDANLKDARAGLDRFYTMKEGVLKFLAGKKTPDVKPEEVIESVDRPFYEKIKNMPKAFEEAMDDDFNTAFAVGLIYDLVRDVNKFLAKPTRRGKTRRIFSCPLRPGVSTMSAGLLVCLCGTPMSGSKKAGRGKTRLRCR